MSLSFKFKKYLKNNDIRQKLFGVPNRLRRFEIEVARPSIISFIQVNDPPQSGWL
jgi:hypothetical protein